MAQKRKVGNLLALAVLSYLSRQPMHPYELSRTLREHGDDRSIKFNHGSLYMVVQQTAKAGFITEVETSRDGQRPGAHGVRADRSRPGRVPRLAARPGGRTGAGEPAFVAALSLVAALPPGEVINLLQQRLDRLAAARAQIHGIIGTSLGQGVPELFLIEEQYGLALLDAETAFVEDFIGKITDPQTGWAPMWAQFHGQAAPGH